MPKNWLAAFHVAVGRARRLLRANDKAAAAFRTALAYKADLVRAHVGLARLRLPGDDYFIWLRRLHAVLRPDTYVEIGIAEGHTLALARPPTLAIGIDPEPVLAVRLHTEAHVFTETSDEFFVRQRLGGLLEGRAVSLALIDGLHVYEQALKDFINLERFCGSRSVILFHDTLPLDEPTQSRNRRTEFHTGDVWKTVLCLKHYRPDLDVFTIATPPSGLTIVTGLDRGSRVLDDNYEAAVARFIDMPFAEVEHRLTEALNILPNDWEAVAARLEARAIL